MCSIIGFKVGTPDKHEEKVEEYLKVLAERGDQSFGYFYRTPKGDTFFNKALNVSVLLDQIKEAPKNSWCFMHARKASAGMAGKTYEEKLARAHPVESDDKLVTLIHNGTKASLHDTVYGSLSDSQALATMLSIAWDGRENYYGNIGVVLYEKAGKVYLYKDGIRPLVMSEDNTLFASEPISDKVKWKNVENTFNKRGGTDVILDLKADGLGLKFGKAVEVEFDIAANTVYNFSTAGYPKTCHCSICKKTHIKQKGTFTCCTCRIEGNIVTPTAKIPTATKPKLPYKKPLTLDTGVVKQHDERSPAAGFEVMYACDVNLLKNVGYTECTWAGTATVRADHLYKTLEGLLFVKPKADGKFLVKVDRVFTPVHMKKGYKQAWHAPTRQSVKIVGDIDLNETIELTSHLNLSNCVRPSTGQGLPLKTTISRKAKSSDKKWEEEVAFRGLYEDLHLLKKESK